MGIGHANHTRKFTLFAGSIMPIPKTTHQQFAVLSILRDEEMWGRDVRVALKADGYTSTNPSFYEMMDRMESGGLVEGRYEERDVLGQKFKERKYRITGEGIAAMEEVALFYSSRSRLGLIGGG
jgi:DNA-binding PadR family transcriptional regulator